MKNRIEIIKAKILSQKNILVRLSIFRMIFSLILLSEMISEKTTFQFMFFFDSRYYGLMTWFYPIFENWYNLNILLLGLNFIGYKNQYVKILMTCSLIPFLYLLSHHLSQVTNSIWYYSAFQPIFLFTQLFAKMDYFILGPKLKLIRTQDDSPSEYDFFFIYFCQLYIINMFFLSAVSKIVVSGIQWFWDGDFIKIHTLIAGSAFGVNLVRSPVALKIMGVISLIFELLGYFIYKLNMKVYAITAFTFHMLTWVIMDINFIILWPLYIPLFFDLNWIKEKRMLV